MQGLPTLCFAPSPLDTMLARSVSAPMSEAKMQHRRSRRTCGR